MHGIAWLRGEEFEFPPPFRANEDGLLAMGGCVTPSTLRRAYRSGIFPWPVDARFPVLWFCPPRRFVIELDELHVSRSLKKTIRAGRYEIRWDTAFDDVVEGCAAPRKDGGGTWIDHRIAPAFAELHKSPRRQGVSAHSVEAWEDDRLVGGLYGVSVGGVFSGESMFHLAPDASKVALVALVERMKANGYALLDCQVHTAHLERMGAGEIPRPLFLERLRAVVDDDCTLDP